MERYPREIDRDLIIAYEHHDRWLAEGIRSALSERHWNIHLDPFSLAAATTEDITNLDRSVSRCHLAAVVLSDATVTSLKQRGPAAQRVLALLHARCGPIAAFCVKPGSEAARSYAAEMHLDPVLDCDRTLAGTTLEPAFLGALEAVLYDRCPARGMRYIGLPYTIVAMTREEAAALEANPAMCTKHLDAHAQIELTALTQALAVRDAGPLAARYGETRSEWRPFAANAATSIGDVLKGAARALNPRTPKLRGQHIRMQYYPLDALFEGERDFHAHYTDVARHGAVVMIDELSIFHPTLWRAFRRSTLSSSPQVALVTLSPIDPYGAPPGPCLEHDVRERLESAFDRFRSAFDPQCELGIGDERRLSRWLHRSLPSAVRTLRELSPNARALNDFVREQGLDGGADVASLIYDEDGLL